MVRLGVRKGARAVRCYDRAERGRVLVGPRIERGQTGAGSWVGLGGGDC
jgi:hypothetical protein